MVIKEAKRFEDTTVLLQRGVDYEDNDVEPDLLTAGRLSRIKSCTLTRIAQENGYGSWCWSGFEKNGTVKATFRRDLDPGREGEIAKTAVKIAAAQMERARMCPRGSRETCIRMYPDDPEYCRACIERHLIGRAVRKLQATDRKE